MRTAIEDLCGLVVGAVESVSPDDIRVVLDESAPQGMALNTGSPSPFPRLNGYVLIPNEAGATVAQITWIGSQHSSFPRSAAKDEGLINLPYPLRKMSLAPVGTLISEGSPSTPEKVVYELQRGVVAFPSVGDQVVMPRPKQVEAIVGGKTSERRIRIGTSPLASNAAIMVDPDKLFGRHLAVLGNTGSGKSCTVAGLIRWSLEAARRASFFSPDGQQASRKDGATVNARFVVLDPNGEYTKAFSSFAVRSFRVEGENVANTTNVKATVIAEDGQDATDDKSAQNLKVPAWMWNGEEWAAFTGAAPGVQRPILFEALRRLRGGAGTPNTFETKVRGRVKRYRSSLKVQVDAGDHMKGGYRENVARLLKNIGTDFDALLKEAPEGLNTRLGDLANLAQGTEREARGKEDGLGGYYHNSFSEAELEKVLESLRGIGTAVGLPEDELSVGEDVPKPFPISALPEYVEALAADASGRDVSQFVDSLTLRIRGRFAAGPLKAVAGSEGDESSTLEEWLGDYVGADGGSNGEIAVIDLSLVPSDVVHVIVAVLSRMVFEAVQRYRRRHGEVLPTVLVLDEAHTFAHRDLVSEGATPAGRVCCRTLERIAREGRKFGLGLVLASQRPSEMSPTVLSQCNTFLLHRIVNDDDQNLVARLVPDNVRGLLRELPSLPSQQAILLGWATPVPVLVEVNHLPDSHRPQSADPDFWDVWTQKTARQIDWKAIAEDWESGK